MAHPSIPTSKQKILLLFSQGQSCTEIANILNISKAYVSRVTAQWKEENIGSTPVVRVASIDEAIESLGTLDQYNTEYDLRVKRLASEALSRIESATKGKKDISRMDLEVLKVMHAYILKQTEFKVRYLTRVETPNTENNITPEGK